MINLGRMLWRQSREIVVLNYPKFYVYEILSNSTVIRLIENKDTNRFIVLNQTLPFERIELKKKSISDIE